MDAQMAREIFVHVEWREGLSEFSTTVPTASPSLRALGESISVTSWPPKEVTKKGAKTFPLGSPCRPPF